MISALIPSRGRPSLLLRAVSSLLLTASDPANVEVLVRLDDDDTSFDYTTACPHLARFVYGPPLGYIGYATYTNELAALATGDWLLVFNDDSLMTTEGWDQIIESRGTDLKVLSLDNNHGRDYAPFPAVPRRWYEVCGHLALDVRLDTWLQEVASAAGCFIEEDRVFIRHDRFDLTGNNDDETYRQRFADPSFWTSFDSAANIAARGRDVELIRAEMGTTRDPC